MGKILRFAQNDKGGVLNDEGGVEKVGFSTGFLGVRIKKKKKQKKC